MSDREIEIAEIELKDLLIKKLRNSKFNATKVTSAGMSLLNINSAIKKRAIRLVNGDAFKYSLNTDGIKIETMSTLNDHGNHFYENFMVMLSVFERLGGTDEPIHGKAILYITGKSFENLVALTSSRADYVQRLEKTIIKLFI